MPQAKHQGLILAILLPWRSPDLASVSPTEGARRTALLQRHKDPISFNNAEGPFNLRKCPEINDRLHRQKDTGDLCHASHYSAQASIFFPLGLLLSLVPHGTRIKNNTNKNQQNKTLGKGKKTKNAHKKKKHYPRTKKNFKPQAPKKHTKEKHNPRKTKKTSNPKHLKNTRKKTQP